MAQIIPPITSLPIDSSAAPSVEDIQDRLPSICVDYLSHDWSEEDVWASWRNMTRHKHEIANGVRLENASWRTWQKQRNNLKTISPETLNWLKDSDVTWLYGPLHTANVEPVRPLKVSSTGERLGLDVTTTASGGGAPGPRPSKPILKHRTLSEMLSITTPSSPVLEADTPEGEVEGLKEARPMLATTKSDTNIFTTRPGMAIRRTSPTLPTGAFHYPNQGQQGQGGPGGDRSPNAAGTRTPIEGNPPSSSKEKRHISFNTFVEQCIAVDDPSEAREREREQALQEEDEDDMLEMRSHRSSSSKSARPSLSRHSSSSSTRSTNEPLTIAKIAPTMLKTQTYANSEQLPQMVYQPPAQYLSPQAEARAVSPGMHSPVGPSSYSSQASSTSTSTTASSSSSAGTAHAYAQGQGRKWDDDDGQPYDYFGGPDRSAGSGPAHGPGQVAAAPGSSAQNIPQRQAAPVVGQPPQQPKWRQQSQQTQQAAAQTLQGQQPVGSIDSTLSTSASSSSSSSSLRENVTSPPQPARSILKQRSSVASTDTAMEGDADFSSGSPPNTYFNYNPSAATGIGGMRAAQYLDQAPGSGANANASPLVSPAAEERGRSTSRGGSGTSQYDRSISRGTNSSTGSVGSVTGQSPMSPGASHSYSHSHSRSPVASSGTGGGGGGGGGGAGAGTGVSKKGPAQQQAQQQKVHAAQQANTQAYQAQQAQQQQAQQQQQQKANSSDEMEIDHDESPDRGASTPTPHSSPQILFRPLQDTSPASLPHVSTSLSSLPHSSYPAPPRSAASPSISSSASPSTSDTSSPEQPLSPYASRNPSSPVASHLPRPDAPSTTAPPAGPPLGNRADRNERGMGGRATTASTGTMAAAPHIYQNATSQAITSQSATGRESGEGIGAGASGAGPSASKDTSGGITTSGQAQEQAKRNLDHLSAHAHAGPSATTGSTSSATQNQYAFSQAVASGLTTASGLNRWTRPTGSNAGANAYPDHFPRPNGEDDDDGEGDGGSIMGRAANIASTARDLFGALWYGAHGHGSGIQGQQSLARPAPLQQQPQGQEGAQGPVPVQGPEHQKRDEQQAVDYRLAEASARRGGKHTRGKSIG